MWKPFAFALTGLALGTASSHAVPVKSDAPVKVEGQVVWTAKQIPAAKNIAVPAGLGVPGPLADENLLIDPKSKGVKNVMVWLAPERDGMRIPVVPAPPRGPVAITQAGGLYQPRIIMMQSNQALVFTNGLAVADQYRLSGNPQLNGTQIVNLVPGGRNNVQLRAEKKPMLLGSNVFDWMSGRVGVFDHPYFALTDQDGKFEIKPAPIGKFRIYVQHEKAGWLHKQTGEKLSDGQAIEIKPSGLDLGKIEMKVVY